jgi:hypothetical protein
VIGPLLIDRGTCFYRLTSVGTKNNNALVSQCLAQSCSSSILVLLGALPTWRYSGGWGYYPSGGVGLLLIIVIILLLAGRI